MQVTMLTILQATLKPLTALKTAQIGSRKKVRRAFIATSLAAFTLLGVTATASAQETPRYTIEVMVFENYALKGWTEEHWPEEIPTVSIGNSTALSTRGSSPLYIGAGQKSLDQAAKRMSNGYRVLFHQAWSQNAYASKNAPKVLIESNAQGGTQLLGTVKLIKTRFAHVEVDLEFDRIIPSQIKEAFAKNQQLSLAELPSRWRFHLKESRKIQSRQLHYIDHPLFGVLVQVQLHK